MKLKHVAVTQNSEGETPVPSVWRPTLRAIVDALVAQDHALTRTIPDVLPVSPKTAKHIQEYINDYGETLIPLPENTWKTSCCVWADPHWDVFVDLYTEGEGQSDMVLQVKVHPATNGFTHEVHMVYVP